MDLYARIVVRSECKTGRIGTTVRPTVVRTVRTGIHPSDLDHSRIGFRVVLVAESVSVSRQ